jgi:hypothetical protein
VGGVEWRYDDKEGLESDDEEGGTMEEGITKRD